MQKTMTFNHKFLKATFAVMDKIISRLENTDFYHLNQDQIREHVQIYDDCMNTLHDYLYNITSAYTREKQFPALTEKDAAKETVELIDFMYSYPVSFHIGPDERAYKIKWRSVINTSNKIDAIEKRIDSELNTMLNRKPGDSDTDLSYTQLLVKALRTEIAVTKSTGWNCNPNADYIRYVKDILNYRELVSSRILNDAE